MSSPPPKPKRPHLSNIRDQNRGQLLGLLQRYGAVSRNDLSEKTGLTQAAISRLTRDLIKEGICYEEQPGFTKCQTRIGRRRVNLRIHPEGGFVIAICCSAFSKLISITDISGQTRYQTKIPDKSAKSPDSTLRFITEYVDQLYASKALKRSKLLGAALVIAGSIDPQSGHLIKAPLLNWKDYPIQNKLSESLHCAVRVENIADALCLNYLDTDIDNQASSSNIFLTHISAGMGASLAINHRIVKRGGDEGWIGNIVTCNDLSQIDNSTNLHQTSSGKAILKRIREQLDTEPLKGKNFPTQLKHAVDIANAQDGPTRQIFFEAGKALGNSLYTLTAAYLPEIVIIAGPAVAANAFGNGVMKGYEGMVAIQKSGASNIVIDQTQYIDAAQKLALLEHFFS